MRTRGLSYNHQYQILKFDGSVRWIHSRGFPLAASVGEVALYAGLSQDITDHKLAENEISRLNAELEEQVARRALITNPPKASRLMWVCARKTMFYMGAATPGLNKVGGIKMGGIMIKAFDAPPIWGRAHGNCGRARRCSVSNTPSWNSSAKTPRSTWPSSTGTFAVCGSTSG